jgi:hypothetical protein
MIGKSKDKSKDSAAVRALYPRPNSSASPKGCFATQLLGRGFTAHLIIFSLSLKFNRDDT